MTVSLLNMVSDILFITFHVSTDVEYLDEWWGKPVTPDFAVYLPYEIEAWLGDAEFEVTETLTRDPHPEVEAAVQKAYVFARTPK